MKKVLIGIGTCENFEYVEEHCLGKIFSQTYKDFDVLLVDNSEDIIHSMHLRSRWGSEAKIMHIDRAAIFRDACKEIRQYILDYALYNNYEFLFFVDIDIILEEDTLTKLISHNLDFVTAPIGYMYQTYSTCFVQDFEEKRSSKVPYLPPLKPITWTMMEYEPYFMEIIAVGLSCALVRCSILPGIKFKVTHQIQAMMEDFFFCSDIRKKGVKLFLDKTIHTIHAHVKMPERKWRRL
ncbi:hypothetical protein LCGC14_1192050 [marine sediment metagenome]|uniref:Glycosyltransferase 2-like domain-containing protein n=1 Tax=marine sediment metagenome TaxID=412755 RepID=A0A0F9P1R7_9ZZZZ